MRYLLYDKLLFAPENEGGAALEPDADEPAEGDEPDADEPAEGDEPDADEPAEGDEPDADEPAEPARKQTRVQRLANEARTEREGRIAAETEARILRESRSAPSDNGEAARLRAEKLSIMTDEEKQRFLDKEEIARLNNSQQLTQLQIADMSDKGTYERKAMANPVYAKHSEWVEQALVAARKQGNNPSREALLRWKIGEDALSAKPTKKKLQAKADASARVTSTKSTPTSARSDTGGGKTGGDQSLEQLRAKIEKQEREAGLR